mgnify:CR=1 FL=1
MPRNLATERAHRRSWLAGPKGLDLDVLAFVARSAGRPALPSEAASALGHKVDGTARCALRRLVQRGLVSVVEAPGDGFQIGRGRAYRVSAAGREALEELVALHDETERALRAGAVRA